MAWQATRFTGVRYREHPTRKHGVQKDKYFAIRYQKDGRRCEEGLGWASEGWTAQKSALKLAELKQAAVTGEGPKRLREKREIEERRREEEKATREQEHLDAITFSQYFHDTYMSYARANKTANSCTTEEGLFRKWLAPVVGDKPLSKIAPIDLERIKKKMFDSGKSPRTIKYALATVRVVFNHASRMGFFSGKNPITGVKIPREENKRMRYLNFDEAHTLLPRLQERSLKTHDIALLSLHCGLRASEIFRLCWGDVNFERRQLLIRDTKAGPSRAAFMTDEVFEMLRARHLSQLPNEHVFLDRNGRQILRVSKVFSRTVEELGFNTGVSDRRMRVCFHSLRHTFASWLVENGTDLYVVKELLGHYSIDMTQRYSHLGKETLRRAVDSLQKRLRETNDDKARRSNLQNAENLSR